MSASLVFHYKHLKYNSYSSAPSTYRFIENSELDFHAVAGLRVE